MKKSDHARVLDLREICEGRRVILTSDVHGCFDEFQELLRHCKFDHERDILLVGGDYGDRGPKIKQVFDLMMSTPNVYGVIGNHDWKFQRWLMGREVQERSLQKTLDQCALVRSPLLNDYGSKLLTWLEKLPHLIRFGENRWLVHAGIHPHRALNEFQPSEFCIYGRNFNPEDGQYSSKKGGLWYTFYTGVDQVFFGHIVHNVGLTTNPNTYALDGGCVFGGVQRGMILNPGEREPQIVEIYAKQKYFDRTKKPHQESYDS